MTIYDFEKNRIINFKDFYQIVFKEETKEIRIYNDIDIFEYYILPLTRPVKDIMLDFAKADVFWLTKNIKVVP